MPRVKLPPTPSSSLDIQPKDSALTLAKDGSFALPPSAMAIMSSNSATSRPHPILPAPVKASFELPPPPTRSRRIIQMEPAAQSKDQSRASGPHTNPTKGSNTKKSVAAAAVAINTSGKKQSSSTSAAGKKMARKTAHSVIERRRRSKMNDEFATLKDMIPACKDQEMHKLAILSASIDYLRYLEQCVSDLKAANTSMVQPPPPTLNTAVSSCQDDGEDDPDEDHEMEDTPTTTIHDAYTHQNPQSLAGSPPLTARYASSSYASSIATLPSPAFGPSINSGYSHSASTSPTILPSSVEDDHEATAALLMLNKDRRNIKTSASGRSMSVKDLLSPA